MCTSMSMVQHGKSFIKDYMWYYSFLLTIIKNFKNDVLESKNRVLQYISLYLLKSHLIDEKSASFSDNLLGDVDTRG